MVVCTYGSKLKSKLSAQWEFIMDAGTNIKIAVLIRLRWQYHIPLIDSSSWRAVLSDFADKPRPHARSLTLQDTVGLSSP